MLNPIYNLPEIQFVGGETQKFAFRLFTPGGLPFDANGCNVDFAVVNYANKNGLPIFTRQATLLFGDDGIKNLAQVVLNARDTALLYGRYIYQITITSADGTTEIPGQGIMNITRNIHADYVSNLGG